MRQNRRYRYLAYALALILPALAAAQSLSTQIPRIGFLAWPPCEAVLGARSSFLRGLRDFGYTPDENVTIECRSADRDYDRIAATAAELVDLKVDVIVAYSHPLARGALAATDTIPIVSVLSGDPVGSGMARSLAEPGGNLTGVSYYATELTGKRMDLLMKAIPELTSVDVLANPRLSYLPFEKDTLQAASRLGVTARIHHVSEPADIVSAFAAMKAEGAQAVFVLPDLMLGSEASHIAALALEQHLPTMTWGYWYANVGCLMAYSAPYPDLSYRLAHYVDRILKGAEAGDLPIEQPMRFSLSINLKTAKTLGLELPQSLLLRADKFIE
jgi:putative ABC transport system substrate-binding protein